MTVIEKQPKYSSTFNVQIFFELYERTAVLNGWTDTDKPQHIRNSFKEKLLEWVVSNTFADCAAFKTALKEKQAISNKDDIYYLNKIIKTKRKHRGSANKFTSEFDVVKQRREADAPVIDSETHTESSYIKLFIKL